MSLILPRRKFLSLMAAPLVVSVANIMPVSVKALEKTLPGLPPILLDPAEFRPQFGEPAIFHNHRNMRQRVFVDTWLGLREVLPGGRALFFASAITFEPPAPMARYPRIHEPYPPVRA